jgi:hypothetical protein
MLPRSSVPKAIAKAWVHDLGFLLIATDVDTFLFFNFM